MAKSLGMKSYCDLSAWPYFQVGNIMSHATKVNISTGKSTLSFQHLLYWPRYNNRNEWPNPASHLGKNLWKCQEKHIFQNSLSGFKDSRAIFIHLMIKINSIAEGVYLKTRTLTAMCSNNPPDTWDQILNVFHCYTPYFRH